MATVHFGQITHHPLSESSTTAIYIDDEWAGQMRKDGYPVWFVEDVNPKFRHLLYHADLGETLSESKQFVRDMVEQQISDR